MKETQSLLNKLTVEHFEREQNNQVRDNEICTRKHSAVSLYWDALLNENRQEWYHQPTVKTLDSIVKKPSFSMLVLCFAVMIFFSY